MLQPGMSVAGIYGSVVAPRVTHSNHLEKRALALARWHPGSRRMSPYHLKYSDFVAKTPFNHQDPCCRFLLMLQPGMVLLALGSVVAPRVHALQPPGVRGK